MRKGPGVVVGQAIKHLFKKPATISYPNGQLVVDRNYRGRLAYDSSDCIGCVCCERDCPTGAIRIVAVGDPEDKVFECHLHMGLCISCGQCVESCRKSCLRFTPDVELAVLSPDNLKVIL